MENGKVFFENGQKVEEILINHLVTEGLLTETYVKKHNAIMLLESQNTADTYYYNKRPIDRDIFEVAYADIRSNQTRLDIFRQLGFISTDFGTDPNKVEDNMRRFMNRLIAHFNDKGRELGYDELPPFKERGRFYGVASPVEDEIEEPSLDDIVFGKKNKKDRTSRALEKINSEDLLRGSFYSDMTKIPKTRWSGWLRFWDRERTSVKDQNRRWKKTFVLGYQVEQNLFYEVWYNSIDSTYTIHEPNGTDVSGRSRTMNEAILNLTRMIAQRSKEDALIFNGNNVESKQLARSILKSVSDGVDPRVKELIQLDDKVTKQEKAERRLAISKKNARINAAKAKLANLANPDGFFGERKPAVVDTDFVIGQDAVIRNEPNKESEPSGFKKKENQVTPDVIKHYERQMEIRAELDAKRKEQEEQDRKEKWKKDFFDNIPSHQSPTKTKTEEILDVPSFASGYTGSSVQKASQKREEQRKKQTSLSKKKSSSTEKNTDNTKKREEDIKLKLKKIRDTELGKIEELNESIVNAFMDINESIGTLDEDDSDFDIDIQELTQNNKYDREMDNVRKQAERSQFTQSVLKQNVMNKIYTYDETRALKHFAPSLFGGKLFIGRKDPIILPTDKPSLFKRTKMALFGQRFRADFVIGFSLDSKVDVEVWYITEPNPDKSSGKDTISTFYVFDVTSGRVLRRYLPYYRNTLPIVMAKIGVL